MKAIVFREYREENYSSCHYCDSETDFTVAFANVETNIEVTEEELQVLREAISIFNSKKNRKYVLRVVVPCDDTEIHEVLKDYAAYKEKEDRRIEAERKAYLAREAEAEKKRAEAAKKRKIKRYMKDMRITEAEAIELLNSRGVL